ncbi:MAG: polyhydroxybutyrate depolymerase [Mycobacterium sp.]|nr:polyhydroxybutyrate depolymerase [Mycobacterium sp.]
MPRLLLTVIALLALVTGCSQTPQVSARPPEAPAAPPDQAGLPDGSSVHTISFGGVERNYIVYKPAGLPAAAPLVVVMHGLSGTPEYSQRTFGWDPLADTAKFVVAYPAGVGRSWNTGAGCCGQAERRNIDDIGFITQLVGDISAQVPIAQNQIYAAGMSNGGMMALALACTTGTFAAVAAVSATQVGGPCSPPRPPSVLQIHGTSDPIIKYDGAPGIGYGGGQSIPAVDEFWRGVDGCEPPTVTDDGSATTSTATCAAGRSVELITTTAGHVWPPFATQRIWDFFAAHPQ